MPCERQLFPHIETCLLELGPVWKIRKQKNLICIRAFHLSALLKSYFLNRWLLKKQYMYIVIYLSLLLKTTFFLSVYHLKKHPFVMARVHLLDKWMHFKKLLSKCDMIRLDHLWFQRFINNYQTKKYVKTSPKDMVANVSCNVYT